MNRLTYQVQSCSNSAKYLVSRLAGGQDTFLPDTETTFENLYARIKRTIELLQTIDPVAYNKDWDKELIMHTKTMGSFKFASKQAYLSEYVLPSFFFHLSIG